MARLAPRALVGRGRERELLDQRLRAVRAGDSSVLVLLGERGIGKTALLEYAAASAGGLRILRAAGVESEMQLPFACLHQLCAPLLDRLDRLPGPQRTALATTFGQSEGTMPDRLFVGLAVLGLLADVAAEGPLVCVVDDAQWLDHASAQALGLVARRLLAEPVLMLFAAREPGQALRGLPDLVVKGLHGTDARELLRSVVPGTLDARVGARMVAETGGNPLALLELSRGLTPAQLAGGFGLPAPLLAGRLEEEFARRLDTLPADTRRLVLLAAAEPAGDPARVLRAAAQLAINGSSLAPAEHAEFLEIATGVRFRNPLVRSAVYGAASPVERREAHRALAAATDPATDPDWRAWHQAQAADGPDDAVAAQLERSAGRAQARGGLAAAAAFLERAVALTVDPSERARRALAAAQASYEAGALDQALTLLGEATALDAHQRARARLLHAQIGCAARRGGDGPTLLLDAARELEPFDPRLAREIYLEALAAARFAGPLATGAGVLEVSRAALAAPPPASPTPADLLLEGMATLCSDGFAAGTPILQRALRAFRDEPAQPAQNAHWLALACADVWDEETWRLLATRELERARAAGALTTLPLVLSTLSYIQAISGDVTAAALLLDEMRASTEATGIPTYHAVALWIAALRGHEAELEALVDAATEAAFARGEGIVLAMAQQAGAVLYNGLGRYDAALATVREAADVPALSELGSPRAALELIEAAVRSGERALATRALERLVQSTRPSGSNWALGVEARSRALLSDGEDAERLYREAIARLQRTGMRFQLARTHLLYGEWQRREGDRLAAREHLRTAHARFTAMGTQAFAARAERELAATGERVRKRHFEPHAELTPQEAQVAGLARDGLSNPEIGARLFISPRTVEYHLRKVYSKLNIDSRRKLDAVLREPPSAGTSSA
ncbi:AAA family ATPase [Solirubrobacter ginsenosidimutans]|uniref:AAA family ATPase n=1 Tax=Solirubrobacter ginsenosidimutans TaxID=490573 RepID=A0A9X3MRM6_9ACTN|nr:LuxR family transcriptional regulator [Solirubrobacter ginsenosidimutans]MDA0159920.1 AAA family ATPase [Solirubrobacter ginsenosidimutans]